nr:hypothetical protein [Bifidobacterium breve]
MEQLRRDLNDYVWRSDNQRLHSTPAQTPEEPFFQHFHVPCSRLHLGCTLINN